MRATAPPQAPAPPCAARRAASTRRSTAPQSSRRAPQPCRAVPPEAFEARVDPSQLVVLGATVGLGAYWWLVVVPGERQALARAKRRGDVREYLDGLEQDESRVAERWFYSDWRSAPWFRAATAKRQAAASAAAAESAAQAAPPAAPPASPTDAASAPQPTEEDAFPDREPNFWNLDNPVVATGAALGAMAILATLQHGL